MKVVLLKDVPKLGKKYDIKNVSDGYALNLLIPQGMAQVATDTFVKRVESEKATILERRKKEDAELEKSLELIKGNDIEITEKANEKGSLFSAIHKAEIVARVKAATGVDLLDEYVKLDKPIKETGEHTVEIKINNKSVKFKLNVKAA